jgi:hypothetical protein
MDIATSHAQIVVKDSKGSCGAHINQRVSGYVADLHFWGDAIYVARRSGSPALHLMIAPGEHWLGDIEADGFEVLGKLSDLADAGVKHNAKDVDHD